MAKSNESGPSTTTTPAINDLPMSRKNSNSTRKNEPLPSSDLLPDASNLDTTYRGRTLREWIELLGNTNADTRRNAALAIGGMGAGASGAVPALVEALQDPVAGVRHGAATALGRIGSRARSAVRPLTVALKDSDDPVRSAAATALGNIGPEARDAVPALVEALKDKVLGVRFAAIGALGKIGPDAKAAVVPLAALFSEGQNVRDEASKALVQIGEESVTPLTDLLKHKDSQVRRAAALTLGGLGPNAIAAIPPLAEALTDREAGSAAGESLARYGASAVPSLNKALQDHREYVRKNAVGGLVKLGASTEGVLVGLGRAIRDGDRAVRSSAADALVRAGKNGVEPLAKALEDPDEEVRLTSVRALRRLKSDAVGALTQLGKTLKDGNTNVCGEAAEVLAGLGKPAVALLIEGLKHDGGVQHDNAHTHICAAKALGKIGPDAKEAVPALQNALKDSNIIVRHEAVTALGNIGPDAKPAFPAIVELIRGKKINRAKGVEALKKIDLDAVANLNLPN
jgi:HEAT repeat protein